MEIGDQVYKGEEAANVLNDYFTNIAKIIHSKIPNTETSPIDLLTLNTNRNPHSIYLLANK